MLEIVINANSSIAPFEQLRSAIVEQVQSGELAAGGRLPTVRALAEELSLAPGTVAKAYRELETDGFIETRGRNGSFVTAQGDVAARQAQDAARAYADRIHSLGIASDQAVAYVKAALDLR